MKVEIVLKYNSTDNVKGEVDNSWQTGDNAVRDNWWNLRVVGIYNLGPCEVKGLGALSFARYRSWGTLAIGKVTPKEFDKAISMRRNAQVRYYTKYPDADAFWKGGRKDFAEKFNIIGNDTGPEDFRDEEPQKAYAVQTGIYAKSSSSSGKDYAYVYGIDGPGPGANSSAKKGDIASMRGNFVSFAVFNEKIVSNKLEWYSKLSYKKADDDQTKNNWDPYDVVAGDNETKNGDPIKLSYWLGSPTIDKFVPETISKKAAPAQFEVFGKNFIEGCILVFTKDEKIIFDANRDTAAEVAKKKVAGDAWIPFSLPDIGKMEAGEWPVYLYSHGEKELAKYKIKITE